MKKIYKNKFRELDPKSKITFRDNSYLAIMLQSISGMFNWKSSVVDKHFVNYITTQLERELRICGKVAITKFKNEIRIGRCEWGYNPTWDGECEEVCIWFQNGENCTRKNGVDCVVIKNNILELSDTHMTRFAQQLSDVDLSQVDLLINARCHPIILCKDDETADILTRAFNGSKDGSPMAISSSNLVGDDILGNGESVKVITTTDPQTASLLQYYSHYHLDLVSRCYGLYGLSTFNTGKMAQTNDTEVMGSLASSMVVPIENYKCRLMAVDLINNIFEIDLSVEFGDCWKNQLTLLKGFDKTDYNVEDIEDIEKANDKGAMENETI